ncbi:hypothetical protein CR161_10715 [Prosthecochloris sp. ZM]|uniref:YiiX/YebB-like N1pC/P60 family cysteine hydrolase n=1 Tax=Prosthecochloris sp. ZM TaxID=2283143 RepID=UPI000DF81017|nr:YiiX/YebB-like N1pC/P60 family cysteine hydrolase [Prosthecochloris sp. ZM]RDD31131.1 hypothetical protein CR161_10715 [Prosthecochloris sp. ZM]
MMSAPFVVAAVLLLMLPFRTAFCAAQRGSLVILEAVVNEGDVILRYGNGFWSPFFRDVSPREKRFSHVGIVVRQDGLACVVHASAYDFSGIGQVSCEPLRDFLHDATDFAVYRFDEASGVRERIAGVALSFVGRQFDPLFELGDARRLYCSELVMHALNIATERKVVVPVAINGREIVTIDNCYADGRFFSVADKRQFDGAP